MSLVDWRSNVHKIEGGYPECLGKLTLVRELAPLGLES